MESELRQDIAALQVAIDQVKDVRAMFEPLDRPAASNTSASNIHVNAGGVGIWICSTFCALCLMMSLFTLWVVSEIKQNDRDQGNQLNAIYMMAPHLKPEKKP